jgi:hypothetical protein
MSNQRQRTLIAWRFEPPQRKGQAIQEEQDWYQQGGDRTAGTEQKPQKWFIDLLCHISLSE